MTTDSIVTLVPRDEETTAPVFIVGYPRSGTTLLQLLVAAHDGFASAPETHFFRYALSPVPQTHWPALSPGETRGVLERLGEKPDLDLSDDIKTSIVERTPPTGWDAGDLLDRLMRHLCKPPDHRHFRWVEKTPRHGAYIPHILRFFPDARIVHLLRDPRDVVSSLVAARDSTPSVSRRFWCIQRARDWRREVSAFLAHADNHENVGLVRYEDLVTSPQQTLSDVLKFLGGGFNAQALGEFSENYENVVTSNETHKALCSVGEIVDRRGIWKRRLTAREGRLIRAICWELMQMHGYQDDVQEGPRWYDHLEAAGAHLQPIQIKAAATRRLDHLLYLLRYEPEQRPVAPGQPPMLVPERFEDPRVHS